MFLALVLLRYHLYKPVVNRKSICKSYPYFFNSMLFSLVALACGWPSLLPGPAELSTDWRAVRYG